jgi:ribose transport system substrate-binding protein
MNPLRVWVCLAALALPLLAGCGGPSQPRVGFVTNNPEDFWKIAEVGAKKAAAEEKVDLLFKMPDQGEVGLQKEIIKTLLSQDVKALAVSVISPEGQKDYLNEVAAKIPLLTQDNDAPDTGRVCYIGTDNYEAGKAVGKLVKEALPDGGVVAIFVGDLKPLNARQRRQGVVDELAGAKDAPTADGAKLGDKYQLLSTYLDQPEGQSLSYQRALACLTELEEKREKRPVCMVGLWAYNPPAILKAVEKKGLEGKVKIVAFDEHVNTLKGIAAGHIHGTVVQNPYRFGEESVRLMAALVRGDRSKVPASGVIHVPHRIITKDGGEGRIKVDVFQAELDQLLGK